MASVKKEFATAERIQESARRHADREITTQQARQLADYLNDLLRWNQRINLVGERDWETAFVRLVMDSLFLADLLDPLRRESSWSILDIGAGAGIPGIPYRILRPDGKYTMLEPRGKRYTFLRFVLSRLQLPDTEVLKCRLQDLTPEGTDTNIFLARGVFPWRQMLTLLEPYSSSHCLVVVFSNRRFENEEAIPQGWQLWRQMSYRNSPSLPQRYFWSFTPKNAPS